MKFTTVRRMGKLMPLETLRINLPGKTRVKTVAGILAARRRAVVREYIIGFVTLAALFALVAIGVAIN